jgi:hypothetical protein
MGIMTGLAIAFHNNLVRTLGVFWQNLFMAIVAKLCSICLQKTFV